MIPAMGKVGQVIKNPNNAGRMKREAMKGTIDTLLVLDLRQYAMSDPTIVPSPPAGIAATE